MTEQKPIEDIIGEVEHQIDVIRHTVDDIMRNLEEQRDPVLRVRINVTDSVKGVRTTDTTLEITGTLGRLSPEEVVALRRHYQNHIDAEFPPPPLTDTAVLKAMEGNLLETLGKSVAANETAKEGENAPAS